MTRRPSFTLGALILALPAISFGQFLGNKDDIEWIRNAIVQTGVAINEKNVDGIMKYYAKNILVSYPNIADTEYETFVESYKEMLKPTPGLTTYTVPSIQEIRVSGDLAVVRMMWETTITDSVANKTSQRKAKDLQVWVRERSEWKFIRGMWFHLRS